MSLWFMVFITIATGANLNQQTYLTGALHCTFLERAPQDDQHSDPAVERLLGQEVSAVWEAHGPSALGHIS